MENQYISEIILNNFRNYYNRKINFNEDFNIIIGPNGTGKTNILEAISLFSNSKGIRSAAINDLININNTNTNQNILFSLLIKFFDFYQNKLLIIQKEDKKIIKFNDEILKNSNLLSNILKITWLTPQMDGFFINSSSERRKFIDKTAELLFINHYDNVKKYEFFLKERIKILTTQTIKDNWLDIVEKKIVQLGVSIASIRNETIIYLNNIFENNTTQFPTAYIDINGDVEQLLKIKKATEVENYYIKKLNENRSEDIRLKRTNFGIHKSDINVFNKNKNIKATLCSTGEQKMLLISLIIVRSLFSKQINKGIPILLLDEICSHIDTNTKLKLFEELKKLKIQTFITGIDKKDFTDLSNNFIELCNN